MKADMIGLCFLATIATGWGGATIAADPGEARALRRVSGIYGISAGLPDGFFIGKVGNDYHEHASVSLVARSGTGKSTLRVNIFGGHVVHFVGITARVKAGGDVVTISGGRVKGNGLLPLGVRIVRGRVVSGSVTLGEGPPEFHSKLFLRGFDLANANAAVSGTAIVNARK